jgi:hypothetical protein
VRLAFAYSVVEAQSISEADIKWDDDDIVVLPSHEEREPNSESSPVAITTVEEADDDSVEAPQLEEFSVVEKEVKTQGTKELTLIAMESPITSALRSEAFEPHENLSTTEAERADFLLKTESDQTPLPAAATPELESLSTQQTPEETSSSHVESAQSSVNLLSASVPVKEIEPTVAPLKVRSLTSSNFHC